MLGLLIVGTLGVLGIFAAIVWFCWKVNRMRDGGTMPPYTPTGDDRGIQMSPGWVSPEVEQRYPADFIDRINQPRRRP